MILAATGYSETAFLDDTADDEQSLPLSREKKTGVDASNIHSIVHLPQTHDRALAWRLASLDENAWAVGWDRAGLTRMVLH